MGVIELSAYGPKQPERAVFLLPQPLPSQTLKVSKFDLLSSASPTLLKFSPEIDCGNL